MTNKAHIYKNGKWSESTNFKRRTNGKWAGVSVKRYTNGKWSDVWKSDIVTHEFWPIWTKPYKEDNTAFGGANLFQGIDHRADDSNTINVGDYATIKMSAKKYETGEWMDNWVHGEKVKIIQVRNRGKGRACLASWNKIYSWIYEWDLSKVKQKNPYGYQRSLIGYDKADVKKQIGKKKVKKVELFLKNYYTNNATGYVVIGHHNSTKQPGKFTGNTKDDLQRFQFKRNEGKWVELPVKYGSGFVDDWMSGISIHCSMGSNADYSVGFLGKGNGNNDPRLRITYE